MYTKLRWEIIVYDKGDIGIKAKQVASTQTIKYVG